MEPVKVNVYLLTCLDYWGVTYKRTFMKSEGSQPTVWDKQEMYKPLAARLQAAKQG